MVADIEVIGTAVREDGLGVRVAIRADPDATIGRIRRAARNYAATVYGREWTYATRTSEASMGGHKYVNIELTNLKLTVVFKK